MESTPQRQKLQRFEKGRFGHPTSEDSTEFSLTTKCLYHEVLQHSGTSNGELDHSTLIPWLSKNTTCGTRQGSDTTSERENIAGDFRLLFGICPFNSATGCRVVPFTEDDFNIVSSHLQLPSQFLPTLRSWPTSTFMLSCPPTVSNTFPPSTCFVFKIGAFDTGSCTTVISYNSQQRVIYALVLFKPKHEKISTHTMFNYITTGSSLSLHPLNIPVRLCELTINSSAERLQWADDLITGFEVETGQHEWEDVAVGDPMKLDFLSATRKRNYIARSIALETMRFKKSIVIFENIKRYIDFLANGESTTEDQKREGTLLKELIDYHTNTCQNNLLRAEFQEKKIRAQIAVVYQFMVAKDSKVNIELAETTKVIALESRKDSSAMKAIAVLTMCFLPGTFLAALFAMPLFNWDDDDLPVVKNGFKYYWEIAIPLTLLVLLIWVAAMILPWTKWMAVLRGKIRRRDLEDGIAGRLKDE